MSKQEFSSKWALWLSVTLLVVVMSAMVAWGVEEVEIPFWTTWIESGHADPNALGSSIHDHFVFILSSHVDSVSVADSSTIYNITINPIIQSNTKL